MGRDGETRYEEREACASMMHKKRQVETVLQKSGRPRLTGKTTLPSRQNGEEEEEPKFQIADGCF